MKFIANSILILGLFSLSYSVSGKCVFGNCKEGYGRLQEGYRLYCGNFTDKKLNGPVLIAQVATKDFSAAYSTLLSRSSYVGYSWLAICIVNFDRGKQDRIGKHLFYWPIVENKFDPDLRNYFEYYEGPLTVNGDPAEGMGRVYSELVLPSTQGKRLLADSVIIQGGVAVSASYYVSPVLNGAKIQNPLFSASAYAGNNQKAPLFLQSIKGTNKTFYDKNGNYKKSEVQVTQQYALRVGNIETFEDQGKIYTPDGSLVFEGDFQEKEYWPKNLNDLKNRCISGDCENGRGKLLRVMDMRITARWLDDGARQILQKVVCVFEGKFQKGAPVGIFKMWNTAGYNFTGKLNQDFSLAEGTFTMFGSYKDIKYQGTFGPESEAIGGIFEGGIFLNEGQKVRITKDRKWIKQ